jgi:hypothetical protein
VQSGLEKCTHVFLRQDATCRALEPLYSGPYLVHEERKHCKSSCVAGPSTNRVKPAYILNKTGSGATTTFKLRSLHTYRTNYTLRTPPALPCSLQQLSNHLHAG